LFQTRSVHLRNIVTAECGTRWHSVVAGSLARRGSTGKFQLKVAATGRTPQKNNNPVT
jgi:hypothetical protein